MDYTVLFVGFVVGVNNDWSDGVIRFMVSFHPLCMEDGGEFPQNIPHV